MNFADGQSAELKQLHLRGFTLVELLVCVGIISLLVSLLLPAMTRIRESGHAVVCQNNERQLWNGFTLFAADHENRLPGNFADSQVGSGPAYTFDWVGDPNGMGIMQAPRVGTIFKYTNNYGVYHCPSVEPGMLSDDGLLTANSRFDYVAFQAWSGSHLNRIPATVRVFHSSGLFDVIPTPIISEYIGNSYGGGVVPNSRMAHQHSGGCYYVSGDGSVNWHLETPDVSAGSYWAMTPRGTNWQMSFKSMWGWFEVW